MASLTRAQEAISEGRFRAEIVPLTVTVGKEQRLISDDEQPPKAKLDKIASLKPAFRPGGTVTAANSSSISDGAAALELMRQSEAQKRGLTPLAVIRGHAAFADTPGLFPGGTSGRDPEVDEKDWLVPGPGRSLRNQRSLRRGHPW